MSELVTVSDQITMPAFATTQEAEDATQAFVKKTDMLRHDLLDLFLRNAHSILGYDSFELYADERLNIQMDKQRLYHMRQWAQAERTIAINNESSSTVVLLESGIPIVKMPRDEAMQIAKLPDAQHQRIAWERYEGIKEAGVRVPGEYLRGLKNIVAQMLGKPEIPAPVATPAETTTVQTQTNAEPVQPSAEVRSSPPAPTEPVQTSGRVTRTPAVVSSFTPAADTFADDLDMSEAKEPIIPDWEEWQIVLDTMAAMVTNKEIEPMARIRKQTACTLRDMVTWLEA